MVLRPKTNQNKHCTCSLAYSSSQYTYFLARAWALKPPFRQSTGNDVSGLYFRHYSPPLFFLFFSSVATFSHIVISILFISTLRLKSGKNKNNLSITKAHILPQDEVKNKKTWPEVTKPARPPNRPITYPPNHPHDRPFARPPTCLTTPANHPPARPPTHPTTHPPDHPTA